MSVTLDQILALTGPFDGTTGFDSPRERFRRFLLDYVRDALTLRAFIDQCQHAPGEPHQRALQDLVTLLGRFLGFDTTFGASAHGSGLAPHGVWRSRGRLSVIVEVRPADQRPGALDALARAASALGAGGLHAVGLSVFTPLQGPSPDHSGAIEPAEARNGAVASVSLGSLLSLASMVRIGRITHEEIVRLLDSNLPLDFLVGLLERPEPAAHPDRDDADVASPVPSSDDIGYWIATVTPDHASSPDEFLEQVVSRRRIFGITDNQPARERVKAGDRICFHVAGKGVVGDARVVSLAESGGMREPHRFRQIVHLEDLTLRLGAAAPLDAETQLRLRAVASLGAHPQAQTVVRISRESFEALTGKRDAPPQPGPEPSAADSRSPA